MNAILVPTDGSTHAHKAIDLACDLAEKRGAALLLVHVLLRRKEPEALMRLAEAEHLGEDLRAKLAGVKDLLPREEVPPEVYMRDPDYVARPVPDDLLASVGSGILDAACRQAAARGVTARPLEVEDGEPAERILACAQREGVETLIMGSRGLSEIDAMTFGSVSHRVFQNCPGSCTCISVK